METRCPSCICDIGGGALESDGGRGVPAPRPTVLPPALFAFEPEAEPDPCECLLFSGSVPGRGGRGCLVSPDMLKSVSRSCSSSRLELRREGLL